LISFSISAFKLSSATLEASGSRLERYLAQGWDVQTLRKNTRKESFAQYVHSQGGLVLFASEFEKYLRKKTGKSFTFKSLFKRWFETEARQKEFAEHLVEFFGQNNEQ